jgi:hypothetical protein
MKLMEIDKNLSDEIQKAQNAKDPYYGDNEEELSEDDEDDQEDQ